MRLTLMCVVLFFALSVFGCASLQVERTVQNNTFQSSYPEINAKIDNKYKYIGQCKDSLRQSSISGRQSLRYLREAYCFVELHRKDYVKSAIAFEVTKIDTGFISDFWGHLKNTVEKGTITFNGEKFQYVTQAVCPSASYYISKHYLDQDYIMPCGLLKRYGRLYGTKNDILFVVHYYEDLAHFGGDRASWRNADSLTDEKVEKLKLFNERFFSSITTPEFVKAKQEIVSTPKTEINYLYILLHQSDKVHEFGKLKYTVETGDILKVLSSKTCRSGSGLCWKVMNQKTGEIGYVRADRMKKNHKVYADVNTARRDQAQILLENKTLEEKTSYNSDIEAKQEIASIPKDVSITRVSLRKEPKLISSVRTITEMLTEYGLYDIPRNILGSFNNNFIDNNDGTVTDIATRLMWQKAGSSSSLVNGRANSYIIQLNKKRFAGYSDWRMPTVEELASLINKSKINGVHISPVFDNKQIRCWTIDASEPGIRDSLGAWLVDFKHGTILEAWYGNHDSVTAYMKNSENYVKAVRSVKEQ